MNEYLVVKTDYVAGLRKVDVHVLETTGQIAVSKFVLGFNNGLEAETSNRFVLPFGSNVLDLASVTTDCEIKSDLYTVEDVAGIINGFIDEESTVNVCLSGENIAELPDELYERMPTAAQKTIRQLRQIPLPVPGHYL